MQEQIVEMVTGISTQKCQYGALLDDYLIQFVLSSFLSTFTPFKVGYFQNPQKWTINELILMCDCEERRMKQEGHVTVNLFSSTKSKGMKNKGNSSKKGNGKKGGVKGGVQKMLLLWEKRPP